MTELIHAREIIQLVSGRDYTVSELNEKFGVDAIFTNCSEMEFSLMEIIEFLVGKNKFVVGSDIVSFNREEGLCSCN